VTTVSTSVTIEHAEDAIKWAKSIMQSQKPVVVGGKIKDYTYVNYEGKTCNVAGWCLQFVANAYNQYNIQLCTSKCGKCYYAIEVANGRTLNKDRTPPRGALVFFKTSSGEGHVGISLGKEEGYKYISALLAGDGGVTVKDLNYVGTYLGWCYPSNKYN